MEGSEWVIPNLTWWRRFDDVIQPLPNRGPGVYTVSLALSPPRMQTPQKEQEEEEILPLEPQPSPSLVLEEEPDDERARRLQGAQNILEVLREQLEDVEKELKKPYDIPTLRARYTRNNYPVHGSFSNELVIRYHERIYEEKKRNFLKEIAEAEERIRRIQAPEEEASVVREESEGTGRKKSRVVSPSRASPSRSLSLDSSSSSSQAPSSAENPFQNESPTDAQIALDNLERQIRDEMDEFRRLNTVIYRHFLNDLDLEDSLYAYVWRYGNYNFLKEQLESVKTQNDMRRVWKYEFEERSSDFFMSLNYPNRSKRPYDPKSASLEEFEQRRAQSVMRVLALVKDANYHIDVLNTKHNIPRQLALKEHIDWPLKTIAGDEDMIGMWTIEKIVDLLQRSREEHSYENLMKELRELILDYNQLFAPLPDLEAEWIAKEKGRPDEAKKIKDQWDDIVLESDDQRLQIEGLIFLLELLHPQRFNRASLNYAEYGTLPGQNMPPWREEELRNELRKHENDLDFAQRSLEKTITDEGQWLTKDELLRLYAGKEKGYGFAKNAAEEKLRKFHLSELGKQRSRIEESIARFQNWIEEDKKRLADFLTKKAAK